MSPIPIASGADEPSPPFAGGGRRRARLGIMALVLLLAATASLVLVNIIGARVSHRFDLTAAGEHQLSPRTRELLRALAGSYEFVLAGPLRDSASIPPSARERVDDVLERLVRESAGRLRATRIDTGSVHGAEEYDALLKRLRERDGPRLALQRTAVESAAKGVEELAGSLDLLSRGLIALRDAMTGDTPAGQTNRQYVDQRAGECGNSAQSLRDLGDRSRAAMAATSGVSPDWERIAGAIRGPLTDLRTGLADIAGNIEKLAGDAALAEGARDRARGLASGAARLRDQAALLGDALDRLPRLDTTRVSRVLEKTGAMLLIGPSEGPGAGLTAVPLEQLFPTAGSLGSAEARRNAEELLTTALGSLARPIKPIVVVVHGQSRGFFQRPETRWLDSMEQRLGLRGIDVAIWEAAVDAEPPTLTRLDPKGERPVVYLVINTQSYAASAPGAESGAERVKKLGAVVKKLIDEGRPVLLNLYPSTLPTYGEKDPMTEPLRALGLECDTGRVLLREGIAEGRRRVESTIRVRAEAGTPGPAAQVMAAIRGLPVKLDWPVAIRAVSTGATKVASLLSTSEPGVWNESQWLGYIQVPISQQGNVPDPPKNDSTRDDGKGPWTVAAAVERERPGGAGVQRAMVVGGNTWFFGPTLDEGMLVDGRIVASNPGNAELVEASVYWLAGQDEMIATSATARAVPLVRSLDAGTLAMLRGGAVIGMPALVLLAGVLWRWWKG